MKYIIIAIIYFTIVSSTCLSAHQLDYQAIAKLAPDITPRNSDDIGCFIMFKCYIKNRSKGEVAFDIHVFLREF